MMQSVQVIIERLKTNPEDFFGDISTAITIRQTPKFQRITEKLDDLLIEKKDVGHIHRLWYLEPEEKEALLEAYKEARRARFEAKVFHTLLSKQEPEEYPTAVVRKHPSTGKRLMQGPTTMIAPQNMLTQAQQILEKEYAKISRT
jgi:hypothetical protein